MAIMVIEVERNKAMEVRKMTEKERNDALEVVHITGVQGIRAAMETLAREADGGFSGQPGASLPGSVAEEVPQGRRTCAVCAADNDGARDTCWNCGASLRRAR